MMGIRENIKILRDRYDLTQQDLADIAGVTNKAVSAWESGLSEPRIGAIERIANKFNLKKSNIIEEGGLSSFGVDLSKNSLLTPLVGIICAGDGLLAEQNVEEYIMYPFPNKRQPDYALRVKGNSMIGAGIEDGDIVYFRKAKWAEYNGQIVAALVNDSEEGTLKRMKWSEGSPIVRLEPENEKYDVLEVFPNEIMVCGVYAGHFKPEKGE